MKIFLSLQMFPPPSNLREPKCRLPRGTTAFHKQENPCFPASVGRSYCGTRDGRQEQSCFWHLINSSRSLYYVGVRGRGGTCPGEIQNPPQVKTVMSEPCRLLCVTKRVKGATYEFHFVSFIRLQSWRPRPCLLTSVSADRRLSRQGVQWSRPSRTCFTQLVLLHHAMSLF